MLARIMARRRVNQAPSGTLVSAEERNRPSSVTNGINIARTRKVFNRQTMIATKVTIQVVIKVTRMTQTP